MEQESRARRREVEAEASEEVRAWAELGPPVQLPNAPSRFAVPLRRGRELVADTFAALRYRDFRLFYAGQVLSLVGSWMHSTAEGWLVLQLTNSELLLGLVTAAGSLPILLFSLYAGVVADRRNKRDIILIAQIAALLLAFTLAVLVSTGRATFVSVLLVVFAFGIENAFEIPARQAWFAELVGREELTNAIALNSAAFNLSRIVGPALAGIAIGALGLAACFYANAVSFLAVIAGLLAIRAAPVEVPPRTESVHENIRQGFRFVRHDRLASALVGLIAVASIFGFPYSMLLPVFARDILHIGARGLGWLLSATGAGALAGGITVASLAGRIRRGPLLLVSAVSFSVLLVAFSFSRALPLSLGLLVGVGYTAIPFTATVNGLLQTLVPDELRGRVMAVYVFMFLGMGPVGSLQAGAVAKWLGAPAAVAISAVLMLLCVLFVAARVPELREVR